MAAEEPALALSGRVDDEAGLLDEAQETRIAERSAQLEKQTRHQFVVVTVKSLGGQDISDYAEALGNRRGIGRKGLNDGVLLVVAPNERQVRIAVGAGLMRKLSDAEAHAIIRKTMLPDLRAGAFGEAILKGADRIASELSETIA